MNREEKDRILRNDIRDLLTKFSNEKTYDEIVALKESIGASMSHKTITDFEITMEIKLYDILKQMNSYITPKRAKPQEIKDDIFENHFSLLAEMIYYLRDEPIKLKSKEFKALEKVWLLDLSVANCSVELSLTDQEKEKSIIEGRIKNFIMAIKSNSISEAIRQGKKDEEIIKDTAVEDYRDVKKNLKQLRKMRRKNMMQNLKKAAAYEQYEKELGVN